MVVRLFYSQRLIFNNLQKEKLSNYFLKMLIYLRWLISNLFSGESIDRPLVSRMKKITNNIPRQQFTAKMVRHPCK